MIRMGKGWFEFGDYTMKRLKMLDPEDKRQGEERLVEDCRGRTTVNLYRFLILGAYQ